MNVLIWKEWRENRLLLIGAAGLALVCLVGDATYQVSTDPIQFNVGDLQNTVLIAWAALALLCGSSMISPEVGSGSLRFLDILPVSRSRVWWVKFRFGLVLLAACLVVALATNLLLCRLLVVLRLAQPEPGFPAFVLLGFAAAAMPLYAVGLLSSVLFDRTISAFMASIGIAVALAAAITEAGVYASAVVDPNVPAWQGTRMAVTLLRFSPSVNATYAVGVQQLVIFCLSVLSVPIATVMSFVVFTRGETLQTRKRFRLLATVVIPLAVLAVGAAAAWMILWL